MFSMSQEARDTGRHFSAWGSQSRLRDNAITFVSAGNLHMNEDQDEEEVAEDPDKIEYNHDTDFGHTEPTHGVENDREAVQQETAWTSDMSFRNQVASANMLEAHAAELVQAHSTLSERVHDMHINAEQNTPQPQSSGLTSVEEAARSPTRPRSTSPSSTNSEEEVIVFGGRNGDTKEPLSKQISFSKLPRPVEQQNGSSSPPTPDLKPFLGDRPTQCTLKSLLGRVETDASSSENNTSNSATARSSSSRYGRHRGGRRLPKSQLKEDDQAVEVSPADELNITTKDEENPFLKTPKARYGRHRGRRGPQRSKMNQEIEDEEEALIQDYIDNMKDDDTEEGGEAMNNPRGNEHYRFLDGAAEEHVKVQTQWTSDLKLEQTVDDDEDWSSGDLEDFDGLETTDEEIDEISRVLSFRRRPTGLQYLVTALGKNTSEARWILQSKLTSATATKQIETFEEKRKFKFDFQDESSDSESDSEVDEALDDLVDHIQSEDEENERVMKRALKMTDEQIARALARQEAMGMPANEVLLFDGQEDDDFNIGDHFIPFSAKKHLSNRTMSKQKGRKKDHFPSAEAFADVLDQDPYDGFDVMDFERPSLRLKRKGRKSAGLPFELEDADLAMQIQQAWENDRAKKSARKREREEMRQAGLLGSKAANGRVGLMTKYGNSGMDADQIRAEIRSFMVSDQESLALASMEAHMRASVHRLAKALSLKSHSQGTGQERFPILTKTPHTPYYIVDTIWEIDALMNQRKFFPKIASSFKVKKDKSVKGTKGRRSGGGGVLTGASYMDGDVVGASAPEIASDNRGRAMLEKMGWSSGMGIGKDGNKGSIEVVKHVVKNSKAGLG